MRIRDEGTRMPSGARYRTSEAVRGDRNKWYGTGSIRYRKWRPSYLDTVWAGWKKRLWMGLDNVNEWLITMRDNTGEDRVYLGHETSDTASPQDDDWSVSFRGPVTPTGWQR